MDIEEMKDDEYWWKWIDQSSHVQALETLMWRLEKICTLEGEPAASCAECPLSKECPTLATIKEHEDCDNYETTVESHKQ
jgi:hypothetical protein